MQIAAISWLQVGNQHKEPEKVERHELQTCSKQPLAIQVVAPPKHVREPEGTGQDALQGWHGVVLQVKPAGCTPAGLAKAAAFGHEAQYGLQAVVHDTSVPRKLWVLHANLETPELRSSPEAVVIICIACSMFQVPFLLELSFEPLES